MSLIRQPIILFHIDFCTRSFPASDSVNRKTLEAEYLLLKQKDKPQGSFRPFNSMGFLWKYSFRKK